MKNLDSCFTQNDLDMPYPRVCAHRGFNTIAPENSLIAFGAAIALGADEFEFDVRFSADGVPVSVHDNVLERVSDGKGIVEELTFAELEKFDFGKKRGAEFTGLRILKLEDIFKRFARQAIMNIHVKSVESENFPREDMQKIVDIIRKYGCEKHVYFMGHPNVMEAAIEIAPEIRRCMGAGSDKATLNIVEKAIKWQCHKVQLFKPYYNQEMIDKAHANGILCNIFWSDDPEETRKMLEMGIDCILTNDYFRIAQVRDEFLKQEK